MNRNWEFRKRTTPYRKSNLCLPVCLSACLLAFALGNIMSTSRVAHWGLFMGGHFLRHELEMGLMGDGSIEHRAWREQGEAWDRKKERENGRGWLDLDPGS